MGVWEKSGADLFVSNTGGAINQGRERQLKITKGQVGICRSVFPPFHDWKPHQASRKSFLLYVLICCYSCQENNLHEVVRGLGEEGAQDEIHHFRIIRASVVIMECFRYLGHITHHTGSVTVLSH